MEQLNIVVTHNDDKKEKFNSHTSHLSVSIGGEYGNELEFPSQYIYGYGETLEESMDDLYDKLSDLVLLCETITHNIEDIRHKIRSKNLEYIEVDGFGEPLY